MVKENTCASTRCDSTLRSTFAVQQPAIALEALEGIIGCLFLVDTKVVLVDLFVLELINISPDDDTDILGRERKIRRTCNWR